MSEDKGKMDPEVERFIRENREMLERMAAYGKEFCDKTVTEGRNLAEQEVCKARGKSKEVAGEFVNMITDPEVQRHFMTAAMEIMLGVSALVHAAPMPSEFKDMFDKAEEARERTQQTACDLTPQCSKKKQTVQKVEIKNTRKTKSEV